MAAPIFACSFDCGHRSWVTEHSSSGIDWCYQCGKYVGVFVLCRDPGSDTITYSLREKVA